MNLFNVYPLFDIAIKKGEGCYVWDENDNKYLDLYGGHAVISIGHSHPHYIQAIQRQLNQIGFYSNSVINPLQEKLAEKLGELSEYPDYQLFLVNSGAEANENALKLASFHNERTNILAFKQAFHGRTSLAVEVTDNPKITAPINNNNHVKHLPINDLESFKRELSTNTISAVIVEPIQGVGGIQLPSDIFLKELSVLCKNHNTLLILDEIQAGYGRSGKFFAHQYAEIKPDIITVAKGIANGFPMAGLLINPAIKASYGLLGTTFGGNHLACSAAIAVLEVIEKENLINNAKEVGEYLLGELKKIPQIKEVRGKGLMIGLEFHEPISDIRDKLLFKKKIFTGVSGTSTIRLLPPLCLNMEQANYFINSLKEVL